MELRIGDRCLLGNRIMEVYEVDNRYGKYLSLRRYYPDATLAEYNGKLSDYQKGLWGGPPIKINDNPQP